ncbi:MAG: hypothetical protein IJR72_02510 [Oscillospiraceae bacterium]|nr:hypothetical protein [Oscillospiraceae bacterium]
MIHNIKKWYALFLALALVFALTACGGSKDTGNAGTTPENADAGTVNEDAAEVTQTMELRLGTSPFVITVPDSFKEGELTEEDIADDEVAYYLSDDMLLDFDVYQFSKEGYPDTLADFVTQEAGEYNATEIVTDATVNDIPVGYYRSVEESDGVSYNVITYAFEGEGEYVEIAFWLDGDNAEEIAADIINTLRKA